MSQPRTWKCEVCGYVHQGDTPPDTCPVCGVGPDMFSPFEVAAAPATPAATSWICTICGHVHQGDAPPDTCPVCDARASLFEPHEEQVAPSTAASVGRIVIVGNGVAGVTAAEQARRHSPEAEIIVISREEELPYYRINLTRYLAGEVDTASLALQPEGWYAEHRVVLRGGEVSGIDRDSKQVHLSDGGSERYDRLILANGAHPFVPPLPGAARAGVLPFRTKAQADTLAARARSGSHAVVIGGGLLGLEAAGALRQHGVEVSVLESFGWLLPRQLAEPAGRLLQRYLEGLGVRVVTQAKVEEIAGDEAVRAVRLDGGVELPAELVVLATGVRPNSYLARQSGLEVNRGVVVDDAMRTSDPDIFAAGDVAEHRGVLYGLWPSAYAQGAVAGVNAAGGTLAFDALPPANRLKVLDVDLFSIGRFQPEDGSFQVLEEHGEGSYLRLVCRDGQLVGANLYGDTALAGVVKAAVEEGTQLVELKELRERFRALDGMCRQAD